MRAPPDERNRRLSFSTAASEIDQLEGEIRFTNSDLLALLQCQIFTVLPAGCRWQINTIDHRTGNRTPLGGQFDGRWPALHTALRLAAANGGLVLP